MKNVLLLLITSISFAQGIQLSAGIDGRNALFGSDSTNNTPQADLLFRVDAIAENGLGVVAFYEIFDAIEFQKWGVGFKQEFKLYNKFTVSYILEPTVIKRNWGQLPIYDAYQLYNLIQSNPDYDEYTEFTPQQLADAGVDIIGYENNKVKYLAFGVSIPVSYMFSKTFGAEIQYNALYRSDLKDRYGASDITHSLYFNLIFKL
jgi:hypothetical protein